MVGSENNFEQVSGDTREKEGRELSSFDCQGLFSRAFSQSFYIERSLCWRTALVPRKIRHVRKLSPFASILKRGGYEG